jgi:iron-sulfur cluster assembly protein|tara:strand:+ start:1303 stop:1665 length:363 start_codon:yes stop_codon:yes gene_type:complete
MKFTESAAKEIIEIMAKDNLSPETTAIRMGVKGGGCSGMTYTLDFDSRKRKFDLEFESNGLTILVDKKSHLYIKGTKVDWSYRLNDHGLVFDNPKAKVTCGCKTSFMIDIPESDSVPKWM